MVKKKSDSDPPWMDPANDRKTPYTDEELNLFVEGFIKSNESAWENLVKEMGKEKAWEIIKDGFRKQDERHISNIDTDNSLIH